MSRLPVALILWVSFSACDRAEPPGADRRPTSRMVGAEEPGESSGGGGTAPALGAGVGTPGDNLPFAPDGKTRLGSIAWRTWVYTDVGPKRTRYGYLRAGSVVDARGPEIRNDGCAGGWYRINPRGFVCVGLGATLDLDHPTVIASSVRPTRGQALPYLYALVEGTPPLLYFRLPSRREMLELEGDQILNRAAVYRERIRVQGLDQLLGPVQGPPDFVRNAKKLDKPYGSKKSLHYVAHAGRAPADSGFAIARVFEWEGRLFGLTTELEIIGLELTQLIAPSEFHGIEIEEGEDLPVAFVMPRYAQKYVMNERGQVVAKGAFQHREALKLTGKEQPGGLLEAQDGIWAVRTTLRTIDQRDSFPSFATGNRKWIDISIRRQTLTAYVGRRPVYATLVSSGRGELGDPETAQATARGTFMIFQKDVSSTMDGDEDSAADSFVLRDVPFVQYFHKGFALHGAYWHDEFGKVRSHGCVNLSPIDAAWLFEWTDPAVPPGWHGVLNKERGTVVSIHP